MARVRIERTTDSHHCECCGFTAADGARIYVNDVLKAELVPSAHCFDDIDYDDDEIFQEVIRALGLNVVYSTETGYCRRMVADLGHEVEIVAAQRPI